MGRRFVSEEKLRFKHLGEFHIAWKPVKIININNLSC